MLPDQPKVRRGAFSLITQILGARGDLSDEDRERLDEIAHLFGVADKTGTQGQAEHRARAS
jgi:hypothetical protein